MVKTVFKISFLSVLFILLSFQSSTTQVLNSKTFQGREAKDVSKVAEVNLDYGKIPLYFIPNEGQVNEKALFYAKASKYTLWLTKEGFVFDSTRRIKKRDSKSTISIPKDVNNPEDFEHERDVSRLIFLGSNKNPKVVSVDATEHRVNYFIGNDESKWKTDILTSKAVLYKELYKNIDLKVYGVEREIEYDFIVKPGGETSDISFEYRDVKKTEIDEEGNLVIETEFGELRHAKPECYQVIGGKKIRIEAEFKKIDKNIYGFRVKEYDKDYRLIIDPLVLVYSTYLGGANMERGNDIAVDKKGAAYVTGYTKSANFPKKKPIQRIIKGDQDVFITKINPEGSAILYSTYLGGSYSEQGTSIAVDEKGAAYVTGYTESADFPKKKPIQGTYGGSWDAFIAKINPKGNSLLYSTHIGGSYIERGYSIAVDKEGAAYVTGYTESADFPTKKPIQGIHGGSRDAFIAKINPKGNSLLYSTYLGGSSGDEGLGVAINRKGAAYVTGRTYSTNFPTKKPLQENLGGSSDVFIAKINPKGNSLLYSTYLGGSSYDEGARIALDGKGAAYVAGSTQSTNFPLKNPIQGTHGGYTDVFIAKINRKGNSLLYSTYLGGSSWDYGIRIALYRKGAAYVTGYTESANFPLKNPIQGTYGGESDVFIAEINSKGDALLYSTYLGGSNADWGLGIALDRKGAAYVTGRTESTNFPLKNPVQGTLRGSRDVFITKIKIE